MGKINKNNLQEFLKKTAILWVMIALIIVMSLISPTFLTSTNLINVVKQASITTIIGVGMTFVLVTGGIDLSVGSIMAFAGTLAASMAVADKNLPIIVSILTGMAIGTLCGLINGIGVAYIGFPPFIMTLGMMTIARGIPLVYTNGTPIFGLSDSFNALANSRILGIPTLVYYMVVICIVGYIILSKTVLGRRIYGIGGNEEAARLSGIPVARLKMLVYVFSGFLSGIAGILICSRITSGNGTVAEGYEMNAISAAVIGGVSMTGGSGSVLGMVVGAMILTIIQNSFDIIGVNSFYQDIIKGIIILLAVFLDLRGKKK
ncbi:MAG TPA: ABC transporter permease [Candidatus Mediterraneibacter surreyensis]|nr:ABC transporter permease [Candidatus Mediterraneibacter surreyensis]